MIPIQHRAAAAAAAIDAARTPQQRHDARADGLAVKAALEKHLADEAALAAFRKAPPQNTFGMHKDLVRDAPLFLVGRGGMPIKASVKLPDGSMATPNAAGQIVVPASLVPAMLARGFVRANAVMTDRSGAMGLSDPARPNN